MAAKVRSSTRRQTSAGKHNDARESKEPVDEILHADPELLKCYGCGKSIGDRYLLKAAGQMWHEDCLQCDLCHCRLGEVGRHLYDKLGRKFCKRDYLRLFSPAQNCAACMGSIPGYSMAMKITNQITFHLECFKCKECSRNFCVGDRFYMNGTEVHCEMQNCSKTTVI